VRKLLLLAYLFSLSLLTGGCASAPGKYIHLDNLALFHNPDENALLSLQMINKKGGEDW